MPFSDNINALTPRTPARLYVDFTWLEAGAPFNYPDGSSSGFPKVPWGQPVSFQAQWRSPDGLTPVRFEWDFGDGVRQYGPQVQHTFTARNNHQRVRMCATDDRGSRHCVGHQIIFYDRNTTLVAVQAIVLS
jgi:hypothetical protein